MQSKWFVVFRDGITDRVVHIYLDIYHKNQIPILNGPRLLEKVESRMQAAETERSDDLPSRWDIPARQGAAHHARIFERLSQRARRVMKASGNLSSQVKKYRETFKLVEHYMLTSDTSADSITGKHCVMMYMLHCELTDSVLI